MERLDPIKLPLDCASLIEASAGTGKTFAIKNLYLRLLLGDKAQQFSPLTVEQILVVTFTKAATEELRLRIRENIQVCCAYFIVCLKNEHLPDVLKDKIINDFLKERDIKKEQKEFFDKLLERVEDKNEALLRLRIAEQEIDLASILTIHSFCQKMLFQFAFDSGVRFDIELKTDQKALLLTLAQEVWREQFYPMGLAETEIIAKELKTPQEALNALSDFISKTLPELAENQQLFNLPLTDYLHKQQQFISEVKQYWRDNREDIIKPILDEQAKEASTLLNRKSYNKNNVPNWIAQMDDWMGSDINSSIPDSFSRFSQSMLDQFGGKEGSLTSPYFAKNQAFLTAYQAQYQGKLKPLLLYQFLKQLREKLNSYQANHPERGFDDLIKMLNYALKSERGEQLAAQIRTQFPFAMIDEFQDTDKIQYEIFECIFMSEQSENQSLIMIGDPKQSIYGFRGADIFTYLQAAKKVKEKRTLAKNWRSLPNVVENVNALFSDTTLPFLYEDIEFQPVESKIPENMLLGREEVAYYLLEEYEDELIAEHCAAQIQQQLEAMQAGEFGLKNAKGEKTLFASKDIAVLVRTGKQADLIKQSLLKRGIKSVYLSERSSVYQSEVAQDLARILKACLAPFNQRILLRALASSLWGLTAETLSQLKQDERLWDQYVERFVHYHQRWQKQGVLAMLHQLFLQEGITQRLKARENADRLLTDLFHLAELLQSGSFEVENETALLRWYERHISDEMNSEDESYTLRLESEEELIKIITLHGSKGLQYPIVWLPFIGQNSYGAKGGDLSLYHDENAEVKWDFNEKNAEIMELKNRAEFAEDLRLLYVGLTRAESQMNLILPAKFAKGWSAMHYLLSGGKLVLGEEEAKISTRTYLEEKQMTCHIEDLTTKAEFKIWQADEKTESLSVREFNTPIVKNLGQVTSFTALYNYHEWRELQEENDSAGWVDTAQDYDKQRSVEMALTQEEGALEIEENIAYRFPKGAKVGNLLHHFFEHHDFQQAVEKEEIIAMCEPLDIIDDKSITLVQDWMTTVCKTPFGDPLFSLSEIKPKCRLNEWQFFLRLHNEAWLVDLNRLLKEHSELAKNLPPLQLPDLEGFVRGFVDCIAKVNGKFYIIDYKSNFLGNLPQDYFPENLAKTIGQFRYDLQYTFYTLAVHRYLKTRLGEKYDYERDFGGVAYLFLRGMNGIAQSGVYFDKPKWALVEALDTLFN